MDDQSRHKPFRRAAFPLVARRTAHWLVLLALWFQVVLAPALAATPTAWQAELDGRVVICTAAGMVVLNPDGGQPANDMNHAGPSCVFCLPLLHAGLKGPAAPAVPLPALAGWHAVTVPEPPEPARPAEIGASHPPRAPPTP